MANYLVKLRLEGPLGTPLNSGTLFGHLCWAKRELEGEEALGKWLEGMEGGAAFLISDGFREGCVPKPLLEPRAGVAALDKGLKKKEVIRVEDFLAEGVLTAERLKEMLERAPDEKAELKQERIAHNRIDRVTGRTPEEGGLYFVDEWWPKEGVTRDVYVSGEITRDELGALFGHVGRSGYGRDGSTGRGRFTVEVREPPEGLFEKRGKRRMSLSHGSLTPSMGGALYRLEAHYGRLGPTLANHAPPFKHPLILLRPGATFEAKGEGPFGEMLRGMHKDYEWVRHNAWHLTVEFEEG